MRWHVALAMGLMAWGAYALARTRSRAGVALTIPRNGGPRPAVVPATSSGGNGEAARGMAPRATGTRPVESATRPLIRVSWSVRVPEGTPPNDFIYICGNHAALGHWNPTGVALHPVAPHLYMGELRMPAGTRFEYKFTRGTWASVEVAKSGDHRPNRILDLNYSAALESEVEAWADQV